MSLEHDETRLEMFNAGLVRFGIVLSKLSCKWFDGCTVHLPKYE